MRTIRTQPLDYAPRVDFEVRKKKHEVIIYKKIDGHRAQMVVLTIPEWERVKNA